MSEQSFMGLKYVRDPRYKNVTRINTFATLDETTGDYVHSYEWDDESKDRILISGSFSTILHNEGFFEGEISEGTILAFGDKIRVKLVEYYEDIDAWLAVRCE